MIRPSIPCHQTLLALAKSVFCASLLMGCSAESPPIDNTDRPLLATTSPIARMVGAIMGHPVERLVPKGVDATQWSPNENQIDKMTQSFLISNGRGFETTLRKYDLPRRSWLRSADMLTQPPILHDMVEHQHGPEGTHSHGVVDGHTWVDPATASMQLEVIRQRLVQEGFCSELESQDNSRQMADKLRVIHQEFAGLDLRSITLYANRPIYDYLARTHGWALTSFDLDPASPLPTEVASELQTQDGVKIMLFESPPGPALSADLDQIQVQPVVLRTGESPDHDGGWPECLRAGAARLKQATASPSAQK